MTVLEDERIEQAVKDGELDIAVPADIYVPVSGESVICAYGFTREICERYEAKNSDLLSPAALGALKAELIPVMDALGYEADRQTLRIINEYVYRGEGCGSQKAMIFTDDSVYSYPCSLLHGPELCGEGDAVAVVIEDGVIVCCAGINDLGDEGECELYVETAPKYRRRGFASDAVSALAAHLHAGGDAVSYKCGDDNAGSNAVAKRAGFCLVGRRATAVFYEKEN